MHNWTAEAKYKKEDFLWYGIHVFNGILWKFIINFG